MEFKDWLNVSEGDIAEIVAGYDLSNIHIGAIGSHSALDVSDGVQQHNKYQRQQAGLWKEILHYLRLKKRNDFKSIGVSKKGREKTYDVYNKVRERDGKQIGCVDETIIVNDWADALKPEYMEVLRKKNTLFVPSRSTVVYWGYPAIGNYFVPFIGERGMLQIEERSGNFCMDKNQDYLVAEAGIPHSKKFKKIEDADIEVLVKATKGIGKRHFERRFQRINPLDGDPKEIYEQKCVEYVGNTLREYEKELKRSLRVDEEAQLKQKLNAHFRGAKIEEYIPGDSGANLNFFYSPIHEELELLGIDRRGQFPNGEEMIHIPASLRESLLEKAYEMGEKFLDITKREFGRKLKCSFALQCLGDELENLKVVDVSARIPGSPDSPYSPNSRYLFRRPVSFGERTAMEVRYAIKQDRLLEILS